MPRRRCGNRGPAPRSAARRPPRRPPMTPRQRRRRAPGRWMRSSRHLRTVAAKRGSHRTFDVILQFLQGGKPGLLQPSGQSGARPKSPFRADHVGSFLRPKRLLDAREQYKNGAIDAAALRAVEDDAIRDVVKYQEDLGL